VIAVTSKIFEYLIFKEDNQLTPYSDYCLSTHVTISPHYPVPQFLGKQSRSLLPNMLGSATPCLCGYLSLRVENTERHPHREHRRPVSSVWKRTPCLQSTLWFQEATASLQRLNPIQQTPEEINSILSLRSPIFGQVIEPSSDWSLLFQHWSALQST
jgi:hypothetical protein